MPSLQSKQFSPSAILLVSLALLFFLVSRVSFVDIPVSRFSDMQLYARYAHEQEQASRQGASFYEWHARQIQEAVNELRAAGLDPHALESREKVEYPPLTIQWMRLPSLGLSGFESDTGHVDKLEEYGQRFRYLVLLAEVGILAICWALVRLVFPNETPLNWGQRLLTCVLCLTLLRHASYGQLDIFLSLLVATSGLLLFLRCHYFWSYVILALAINFKLMPIVLIPVWLVGSFPTSHGYSLFSRRSLLLVVGRFAVLLGLTVAIFLPFYVSSGPATLEFFRYHSIRGLELNSLYSSLLLSLRSFGHPVSFEHAFGCLNVRSPLSPLLVALAPWFTAFLLLGAGILMLVRLRANQLVAPSSPDRRTIAQEQPGVIVGYVILFLLLSIASNKVFSPQFCLWLLPWLCLVPLARGWRGLFLLGSVVLCALTTLIHPVLFAKVITITSEAAGLVQLHFSSPNWLRALVARNILLLVLTVVLFVGQYRSRPNLNV